MHIESQSRKLDGLERRCFQHPLDISMLNKIRAIPGVEALADKCIKYVVRNKKLVFAQGNAIVVSEHSEPNLYALYNDVCGNLCMPKPYPQLFVVPDGSINAETIGSEEKQIIAINRGVISFCPEHVQRFILGHELGHCLCKHVVYHTIANAIVEGGSLVADFLALPLKLLRPLIMEWSRCSELSADRAGLLACQDFDAACSSFLLMSGHPFGSIKNPEETLMDQAKLYTETYKSFSFVRRLYEAVKYTIAATHPFTPIRYQCLKDWKEMGYYDELLNSTSADRKRIADTMEDDPQMHALYHAVMDAIMDYFEKRGVRGKEVYPLLRKALFFDETLKNTILERVLQIKVNVRKQQVNLLKCEMQYELEMLVFENSGASKTTIDLGDVFLSRDWAFVPKEIRDKMIQCQSDAISVELYNCCK